MKKLLLTGLLSTLSIFQFIVAQVNTNLTNIDGVNVEITAANSQINACTEQILTVIVENTTTTERNVNLIFTQEVNRFLEITEVIDSLPNNSSFTTQPNGTNTSINDYILLDTLAAGEIDTIELAFRGSCEAIVISGTNANEIASLVGNISINEGSANLFTVGNFIITSSFFEFEESQSINLNISADNGQNIKRSFAYENTRAGSIFTGQIEFIDVFNSGITINNITPIVLDENGNTITNTFVSTLNFDITTLGQIIYTADVTDLPGLYTIVLEEDITVTGCEVVNSNLIFNYGCSASLCQNEPTNNALIDRATTELVQFNAEGEQFRPCFRGAENPDVSTFIILNNGQTTISHISRTFASSIGGLNFSRLRPEDIIIQRMRLADNSNLTQDANNRVINFDITTDLIPVSSIPVINYPTTPIPTGVNNYFAVRTVTLDELANGSLSLEMDCRFTDTNQLVVNDGAFQVEDLLPREAIVITFSTNHCCPQSFDPIFFNSYSFTENRTSIPLRFPGLFGLNQAQTLDLCNAPVTTTTLGSSLAQGSLLGTATRFNHDWEEEPTISFMEGCSPIRANCGDPFVLNNPNNPSNDFTEEFIIRNVSFDALTFSNLDDSPNNDISNAIIEIDIFIEQGLDLSVRDHFIGSINNQIRGNFRLELGSERFFPASINPIDPSEFPTDLTTAGMNAYRIRFIFPRDPWLNRTGGARYGNLATLLGQGEFRYELTATCPALPRPVVRTNLFYLPTFDTDIACNECRLPFSTLDNDVNVLCPGCVFPGLNNRLEATRTTLGERDDDNNGFPDNTGDPLDDQRRLNVVTFEDEFDLVSSSDFFAGGGNSIDPGATYTQLETALGTPDFLNRLVRIDNIPFGESMNIVLDSFEIKVTSNGNIYSSALDTVTNPNKVLLEFDQNEGEFLYQITVSELRGKGNFPANYTFEPGDNIVLKAKYRIVDNFSSFGTNIFQEVGDIALNMFLTNTERDFTDTNLVGSQVSNFNISNGGGGATTLINELQNGNNIDFICENWGVPFRFVKLNTRATHVATNTRTSNFCDKRIESSITINPGGDPGFRNAFPFEVRTISNFNFIDITVPEGYVIDSPAEFRYNKNRAIDNGTPSQPIESFGLYQHFREIDPSEFILVGTVNGISNLTNGDGTAIAGGNIYRFTLENPIAFAPNNGVDFNASFSGFRINFGINDTIFVGDEGLSIGLITNLTPVCRGEGDSTTVTPADSVYISSDLDAVGFDNSAFGNIVNNNPNTTFGHINSPRTTVSLLRNLDTLNDDSVIGLTRAVRTDLLTIPDLSLSTSPLTRTLSASNQPFNFTIRNESLPQSEIDRGFIGYPATPGLTLRFLDNNGIELSPVRDENGDPINTTDGSFIFELPTLARNETQNFTVEVTFDCSDTNNISSVDIFIGADCFGFPTSQINAAASCFYDTIPYQFNLATANLTPNVTTQNNVDICDNIEYTVTLESDNVQGQIEAGQIFVTLPNTLQLDTNTALIVNGLNLSGEEIIDWIKVDSLNYILQLDTLSLNNGENIDITFEVIPQCDYNLEPVRFEFEGTTFCGEILDTLGTIFSAPDTFLPGVFPITADFTTPNDTCFDVTSTIAFTADYPGTNGSSEWFIDGVLVDTTNSFTNQFTNPGTFVITHILTAACCTDTITDTLTVVSSCAACSANADFTATNFCVSDTVLFNSVDETGTHIWNFGVFDLTSNSVNPSFSYSVPGTYTVTHAVTADCGATDITTQTITIHEPSKASIVVNGTLPFCNGDSIVLAADGVFNNYLWTTGETTPSIVVTEPGVYGLEVVDSNGCTTVCNSVTVTTTDAIDLDLQDVVICNPTDIATLDAGDGFESYLWSTGETTPTITVTGVGQYSVEVQQAGGCMGTDTVNVVLNDIFIDIPDTTICAGDAITITTGINGSNFNWSTGATTPTIVVGEAGNYSVSVIDVNGCLQTDSFTVDVIQQPDASFTQQGGCEGQEAIFNPNQTGSEFTHRWEVARFTTNDETLTIPVATAGNLQVTHIISNACFSDTVTQDILIQEAPKAAIVLTGSNPFCEGDSILLGVNGMFDSYLWSTGETTPTIWVTEPGTYGAIVTNSNGCEAVCQAVAVTTVPGISLNLNDTIVCSSNDLITLDAGAGFDAYLWDDGTTTQLRDVNGVGTYTITVTDIATTTCQATATIEVTLFNGNADATVTVLGTSPNGNNVDVRIEAVNCDLTTTEYEWRLARVLNNGTLQIFNQIFDNNTCLIEGQVRFRNNFDRGFVLITRDIATGCVDTSDFLIAPAPNQRVNTNENDIIVSPTLQRQGDGANLRITFNTFDTEEPSTVQMNIQDLTGRIVMEKVLNPAIIETVVSVPNLREGTYIVTFINNNKGELLQTDKIILVE